MAIPYCGGRDAALTEVPQADGRGLGRFFSAVFGIGFRLKVRRTFRVLGAKPAEMAKVPELSSPNYAEIHGVLEGLLVTRVFKHVLIGFRKPILT
jgi:hypothetical protein